jgi:hypothetical protein
MGKKRERSEAEYLRGLVRELKSENRNLKKRLGTVGKKVKRYEQLVDESAEEVEMEREAAYLTAKGKSRCPECKGDIELMDLGVRELHVCTSGCGYRRTFPKKG